MYLFVSYCLSPLLEGKLIVLLNDEFSVPGPIPAVCGCSIKKFW